LEELVVADPRRIDLCDFATLHLRQKLGTDIALLNGLMYILLDKGWEARDFIAERAENFDEFKATIMEYPPTRVSEITGVPTDQLYKAADLMAASKPMAVIWAMGITQHITGVRNVMTLANLQMLLGNMGVPGGGVNPLRGQNNVQGACDMGGLPNVYPAYQPVTNLEAQKKFKEAWGRTSNLKVGLTATEIIPGVLEGKTHALYILGEDPVMSDPDTHHVRECLEKLDFLVLQEIFPSETAAYADVLLPGVSFAEKTGTFTNTERRVQMVIKPLIHSEMPDPTGRTQLRCEAHLVRNPWHAAVKRAIRQFGLQDTSSIWTIQRHASYGGITHARLQSGERCNGPARHRSIKARLCCTSASSPAGWASSCPSTTSRPPRSPATTTRW
jgi:predicted molibdopterin-dependent oxidoreductase YjgC